MEHVRGSTELLIAGTGPQEPALRALAAGDPRIRFTGFLNDVQLADAYAGARVVLFAPSQEDYGYITLEAMLSGKPVITTVDAGGPTELVTPGVTGLIADPDPASIGAAINVLLRKPLMARKMGRAGERQSRTITWDAAVATLLDGLET